MVVVRILRPIGSLPRSPPKGVATPLMEVSSRTWATRTYPPSLPDKTILSDESPLMHLEGDTGSAPLLEPTLASGTGGTTTEGASIPQGVGSDLMSGLPMKVRTDGPGLVGGPLGPMTVMEPREHRTNKLWEGPVPDVQPEKIGLPEYHPPHPILKEGEGARVLLVHGNASGSSSIGALVKSPISSGMPPAECLVQREVCLDPCDSGQLEAMACDDAPKCRNAVRGP